MYKMAFYTLGCKVNTYESDALSNLLETKGFKRVDFQDEADVYIINTCSVTNVADRKSRKIIRQAARNNKVVAVMGCYSQTHIEDVKNIDGVDIIIGTKNRKELVNLIIEKLKSKANKIIKIDDISNLKEFESMSVVSFEHTRAFIKIEDGCNNFCSYCIIPYARGRERSKNFYECIEEAKNIVAANYKEIVLTGIHSGAYNDNGKNLNDLIKELIKIEGLNRLRISSLEINQIDDEFIELLKNSNILVDHLHLPLQSGCDKILKLMNRKYDTKFFLNKISEIRKVRPNIALTTDVIVGFPNETKEDFLETYQFIKKINFYELHVFPFSKRENTVAANMDFQVSDIEKTRRTNELLMLNKELKFNYESSLINTNVEVLFEQKINEYLVGHTSNYLKVYAKGDINLIRNICKVRLECLKDDKLFGKIT